METRVFIDKNKGHQYGPTVVCEISDVMISSNPGKAALLNKQRDLLKSFGEFPNDPDKKGFSIHKFEQDKIAFFVFAKTQTNIKALFDSVVTNNGAKLSFLQYSGDTCMESEPELRQYREIDDMGVYCFDLEWIKPILDFLGGKTRMVSKSQYTAILQ